MASGTPVQVRTETSFAEDGTWTLNMVYGDASGQDAKSIRLTHRRKQQAEESRKN